MVAAIQRKMSFCPVLQYIQGDLVLLTVISINLSDIREKHRSSHSPVNENLTRCSGLEEYLGSKYHIIAPTNVSLRQIHGQIFQVYFGTFSLNLRFQRQSEFQE